jgi:hypothetical protein
MLFLQVFNALDVTQLSVNPVNFIKEYCSVMQSLACALDILQGKQNIYVDCLLLQRWFRLKTHPKTLQPTLKYADPLVDAV